MKIFNESKKCANHFHKNLFELFKFHYQTKHHRTCAIEIQRKSMSLMFIVVVNSYETFYFDYNVY